MSKSFLSLFALVVAAAALIVTLTRESAARLEAAAPESIGAQTATEQRVSALEDELSQLAQRLEADDALVPASSVRAPAETGKTVDAKEFESLESRLAAVERQLQGESKPAAPPAVDDRLRGRAAEPKPDLATLKLAATDLNRTEEERLQALRGLRFERDENGADARDSAVVAGMIGMYHASTDAELRSDILRNLDGVTDPALLPVLLDALASEPDADVRSEAAETLGEYMPNSSVESALRYAAEHDTDSSVRKEARGSLN